jgi:hypothetical protein
MTICEKSGEEPDRRSEAGIFPFSVSSPEN